MDMKTRGGALVLSLLCTVGCMLSPALYAQTTYNFEYKNQITERTSIQSLKDDLFGDRISYLDGGVEFRVNDIEVPSKAKIPVAFGRRMSPERSYSGWTIQGSRDSTKETLGKFWEQDVPAISGVYPINSGYATGASPRCSSGNFVPSAIPLYPYTGVPLLPYNFWSGVSANVPGQGNEKLLTLNSGTVVPSDGVTYKFVTKSGWRISCLPSVKNGPGEGFVAHLPDGSIYYFDWLATRRETSLYIPYSISQGTTVERATVFLFATKAVDRFGNEVSYTYDPLNPVRLTGVSSSDGASISVAYGSNGLVSTVSAGARTWSYAYSPDPWSTAYSLLTKVTLPDTSSWDYEYVNNMFGVSSQAGNFGDSCIFNPGAMTSSGSASGYEIGIFRARHPSGAVGEFKFKTIAHGANNVTQGSCTTFPPAPGGPAFTTSGRPKAYPLNTLFYKAISGPGMTAKSWGINYSPSWSYASECGGGCPTTSQTTVVGSDGKNETYVFGSDFQSNAQQLISRTVSESGTERQKVVYSYLTSSAGQPFQDYVGGYIGDPVSETLDNPLDRRNRPLFKTEIQQCAEVFSTTVSAFDAFVRPVTITKSNTLGKSKTETTEYYDNLSYWTLGQVQRRWISNANVNDDLSALGNVVSDEVTYNAQALPWKIYSFGKLKQTLTYNADGTVSTAADGAENLTTFSNWTRGIPQLITYADGKTQSATVDATTGWITSVTDENGYVTGYGYDAMGRIASIVQPTGDTLTGGATAYHSTWANYRALTDTDWKPTGVSTGQWRKLEGTGDHIAVTYYDAMWRPVLSNEYDQNNVVSTLRAVRTEYDTSGRKSFESYPASVTVPGSTGIRTLYDALDRVTRVEQDSELGVLTTTTEYLAGLKMRVTNPRGQQTTTSFMAWDQPGYDLPILSEQPEGKVIQIARHPQFGWPLSMTQRNAADTLSQTRRYVYDGNAQLCKTIEPETGATVTGYDAAGNPAWSAAGLDATTFGSTTDCQYTAANASGRVTTRTYDTRNRLSQLSFPDGRGNQIWTYTPDGKPASVTAYNGPGNTLPVVMAYTYNHRRLLTGESVSQTGGPAYTWTIGSAYDAYGNLASQTYPTGLTVDYAPNPLGQATKAGTYATGAQYYPNGALKQFTYGNGIVHSMTQNLRQLPSRVTSSGGVTDFGYTYDANANIAAIADYARGSGYDRTMSYDGLDRLLTTASPMFGGTDQTHRYTYDALDNLKSWKLAGVKDYADYVYDAQNRLTNIRNTANATVVGLGYDLQGNVINKNGQGYDFDYGNRLRTVSSKESYRYDGLGRRVQTTATDGSKTTLWQYTQAGQMLFSSDWEGANNANQKTHENVYLAGSIVATIDHDWPSNAVIAMKYQHTDALGSPVAVTNAAGTVTERNDYEPYGAVIGKLTYSGIGYTGHVMDGGTGLTYMQQRYYDPGIGRFLSVDPVVVDTFSGYNSNRFAYAANNPYRFKDPDGRDCISVRGRTSCKIEGPNGRGLPTVSFPTPKDWPPLMSRANNPFSFHSYRKSAKIGGKSAASVRASVVRDPTPNNKDRPASPTGTPNDATPSTGLRGLGASAVNNDVLSFSATDQEGNAWVINVTQESHTLSPGFVIRGVVGDEIVSAGEGLALKQAIPLLSDKGINDAWLDQNKQNIDEAR